MYRETEGIIGLNAPIILHNAVERELRVGGRVRIAALLNDAHENGLRVGAKGAVVEVATATGNPVVEFEGWSEGHDADYGDGARNRWFIWPDRIALERTA